MRRLRHLAIVLCVIGGSSCVPLHSSARDVVGRWQVDCEGEGGSGKETLELRPDGHYVYTIESRLRHLTVDGTWAVEPADERLESARVVLRKAPQSCENVDVKEVAVADHTLAPVWEWGHTELSFNPDLGGFRRVK